MTVEAIAAAIVAGIANFRHDIPVTAQAVILQHFLAEVGSTNFCWNGIGYYAVNIPGSGESGKGAAGNQPVGVMAVTAGGSISVRRMEIGRNL